MSLCPCGANADYAACCGRYHAGALAPTAEALMRSRYAAYATGNLDYIETTCAGPAATIFNRTEAELLQLGTEWLELEIIATSKGGERDSEGSVTFTARYRHDGKEGAQTETSQFRRVAGAWVYWDRDVLDTAPARVGSIGRNDPCPCGSGRKYKQCCGVAV